MTLAFGEFVGAHHIEASVFALLDKWMNTYLHEVGREAGMDPKDLQPIRSYRVSSVIGRMPEDQLPGVMIVNNGVLDTPVQHGDGDISAGWQIDIACQVAAKGKKTNAAPRALTLARMYITAIRLACMQQREGVMGKVNWRGEIPNQVLAAEDDRTTCLATTRLTFMTNTALNWQEGPLVPEDDDTPPAARPEWPVVETYDVDVVKVPEPDDVKPLSQDIWNLEKQPKEEG
jgi:hypothetical protein